MHAIMLDDNGGPEVLRYREVADPRPGAGELVVRVAAAGVNFIDTYKRSGRYPLAPPSGLGEEGAGTVAAVGTGVTEVTVGDRVAWAGALGSYAGLAVVPAEAAVPVPAGLDDADAAALMLQGMTAHYLCHATYPVAEGDWVLVHAAAGGVGLLLTQLVVMRGGRVLATAGSPEKAALAREAGAAEVVLYRDEDFAAEARRVTDGVGVAAVYDGVGAATFDAGLASLRPRGTMVLYGGASGPVPPVDLQVLNRHGSLFATRPKLGDYTATREELLARAGDVLGWAAEGRLTVRVGGRYPLAEAAQAHRDLEARRTTGKLLLLP